MSQSQNFTDFRVYLDTYFVIYLFIYLFFKFEYPVVMCNIRHVDRAVNDKNILDNILLSIDSNKTIKHNSS